MSWMLLAVLSMSNPAETAKNSLIRLPIGKIAHVTSKAPTTWGMSGMEMVKVTPSIGRETPIMRTLAWDARTVEILSRTQIPPLRQRDVHRVTKGNRQIVVVRRFYLMEVMPEDARAARMDKRSLADQWVSSIRKVLPQVAPMPSRFGI